MHDYIEAYWTRYALSTGIKKVKVKKNGNTLSIVSISGYTIIGSMIFGHLGIDFFTEEEDAIAAARLLANKKIKSLENQIDKLQKLIVSPKFEK